MYEFICKTSIRVQYLGTVIPMKDLKKIVSEQQFYTA